MLKKILLFLICISLFNQELFINTKKKFSSWGYILSKQIPDFSETKIKSILNEYDILAINGIYLNYRGQLKFTSDLVQKLNVTELGKEENIKRIYPMITFTNPREGIDFLNSEKSKDKLEKDLLIYLEKNKFGGVHFDIEYLPIEYSVKLADFLKELKVKLNEKEFKLTISFFPQIDFPEKISKLHDPKLLKDSVDEIVLMSYDLHNTKTIAGCVTSNEWTKKNLEEVLKHFKSEQVWLGIPAYGYEWFFDSKKVKILSSYDFELISKNEKFEKEASGCKKIIRKKSIIYVADKETKQDLIQIAKDSKLKGYAIWRIGLE